MSKLPENERDLELQEDVVDADEDRELSSLAESLPASLPDAIGLSPSLHRPRLFAPANNDLEEIAEDMLDLMKEVREIRQDQSSLVRLVRELSKDVEQAARRSGREIKQLRDQLLGDRRALVTRNVFDTIVDPLRQFRDLRSSLESGGDPRVTAQLDGIVELLARTLRALGFIEFQPSVGDPFEPEKMESLGTAEGEPGVVLAVVRSGFLTGSTVVMPAGVLIATRSES